MCIRDRYNIGAAVLPTPGLVRLCLDNRFDQWTFFAAGFFICKHVITSVCSQGHIKGHSQSQFWVLWCVKEKVGGQPDPQLFLCPTTENCGVSCFAYDAYLRMIPVKMVCQIFYRAQKKFRGSAADPSLVTYLATSKKLHTGGGRCGTYTAGWFGISLNDMILLDFLWGREEILGRYSKPSVAVCLATSRLMWSWVVWWKRPSVKYASVYNILIHVLFAFRVFLTVSIWK